MLLLCIFSGKHCENGSGWNWPTFLSHYGMNSVEPSGSTSRELASSLNAEIHLVIFKNFVPTLQKTYFVSITEASLLIFFWK
jgi:hypothetical protein